MKKCERRCGCEKKHLTLEAKCGVTALIAAISLVTALVFVNCGTERRMCMSTQHSNAAACLQVLE
jgi:hypothetical protein